MLQRYFCLGFYAVELNGSLSLKGVEEVSVQLFCVLTSVDGHDFRFAFLVVYCESVVVEKFCNYVDVCVNLSHEMVVRVCSDEEDNIVYP